MAVHVRITLPRPFLGCRFRKSLSLSRPVSLSTFATKAALPAIGPIRVAFSKLLHWSFFGSPQESLPIGDEPQECSVSYEEITFGNPHVKPDTRPGILTTIPLYSMSYVKRDASTPRPFTNSRIIRGDPGIRGIWSCRNWNSDNFPIRNSTIANCQDIHFRSTIALS